MFRKTMFTTTILLATTGLLVGGKPSLAAEEIALSVAETELFTLSVSELESYATTGQTSENIDALLGFIPADVQPIFKGALSYKLPVRPQPFQQFLNSNLGQQFLSEMGTVVRPEDASLSSTSLLQTAINNAAASGTGFTVIDVMKTYPANKILLDQDALDKKTKTLGTVGSDLQLLLTSFGINVDVSTAKLDFPAIANLVDNSIRLGQDVETFSQTAGLTQLELDSPEPPSGTVTLQKADLYRLYKQYSALKTQSEQLYQDSGIKVEVLNSK